MLKRALSVVLCVAVILSSITCVYASVGFDAKINYVSMRLSELEIEDGYGDFSYIDIVEAEFELSNNQEKETSFAPFVAFYDGDGSLVDAKRAVAQTVEKGTTAVFSVTTEKLDAEACEIFVLDNNISPYASVGKGEMGKTVVSATGASLENMAVGNLVISKEVGDGEVSLNKVTINGNLVIQGGGSNSIKLNSCRVLGRLIANKALGDMPRVELTATPIEQIEVKNPMIIETTDDASGIGRIVTTKDVTIRGENTTIKKITVDEKTESEISLIVPDGLQTEIEVNSDKGVHFEDGSTGNIEFSTTNIEKAETIVAGLKGYTQHTHVWKGEKIAVGYTKHNCDSCGRIKNPVVDTLSFNISEYVGYDSEKNEIQYLASPYAESASAVKINIDEFSNDSYILYNGSPLPSKYIDEYMGDRTQLDGERSMSYSGKITLINTGTGTGYNVVCIELPVYGVVDSVADNGRIIFKNVIRDILEGDKPILFADGDDKNCEVVKNGKIIGAEEISENDVLSIMWNMHEEKGYVEVLTNRTDAMVTIRATSNTSYSGYSFALGDDTDNFYDVAVNSYNTDEIMPGSEGTAVIDDYNKIVAFFEVYNREYGYIIVTQRSVDIWGDENLVVQMLDNDGFVYNRYLAEKVKLENAPADVAFGDGAYRIKDLELDVLGNALKNQLIAYKTNTDGDIKAITFCQKYDDEAPLYLNKAGEGAKYEAESSLIYFGARRYGISDDTVVFFIQNSTSDVYNNGEVCGSADKQLSKVGAKAQLIDDMVYDYAQVFNATYGAAEIVVIYNASVTIENIPEEKPEEDTEEEDASTSGCGYVIATELAPNIWGDENLVVQMLDEDGYVYNRYLAEKIKLENAPADVAFGDGAYKIADLDLETLGTALKNQMIAYETNMDGDIKVITFCQSHDDAAALYLNRAAENAEYDAESNLISLGTESYGIADDTVVFFIQNSTSDVYNNGEVCGDASYELSQVSTKVQLNHGMMYDYVQIFNAQNGSAEIVVIYNSYGVAYSPGVVVIDEVCAAVYGDEDVLAVKYFAGGEKCIAFTHPDYVGSLDSAERGDIYKLGFVNEGKFIKESIAYADFYRHSAIGNDGAPELYVYPLGIDEAIYCGPVIENATDLNEIRIARLVSGGYDFETYDVIKCDAKTNVYVLNPNKRKGKLAVGSATDAKVDDDVISHAIQSLTDEASELQCELGTVAAGEAGLGLMDYAVAYKCDGEIIDIIIYKGYNFGEII